jgi:peptide/nickel transport system permease protein
MVGSVVIIVLTILLAVFAPLICSINGQDPYTYHLDELDKSGVPLHNSTFNHWFGVEPLTGRDLFAIVVFGARTSLLIGFGATVFALLLGSLVGVIAGFVGGKLDTFLSRSTDLVLLFPELIFMIALRSLIPDWFPRELLMILVIGAFGWGAIARVVRSQTLVLANEGFILSSRVLGAKKFYTILRHLLPNLMSTIVIFGAISIPGKIGSEAALSFLGVGISAPTPSWGRSIADAVQWINVDALYLVYPGLALFLITFAFNMLGDFLNKKYDPRRL